MVVGLIVAYTLLFFWLACQKWAALSSNSGELAEYNEIFLNSVRGRWFYSTHLGSNYLGHHLDVLLILALPVYALLPSFQTLFLVQSLAVGVSGWFMYRIAQRVVSDDWLAGALAFAYLLYPTIATTHVNGFHGEVLALPFLLLAFWAYQEEKFGVFICSLTLALGGQENLSLTCFMFGPYAFWQRRTWKWGAVPMILSAVYFALAVGVVMPWFRGGKAYYAATYFADLGATSTEVVGNCLRHPWVFIERLFAEGRPFYLISLLQPLMWFIPLYSRELLLAVPNLSLNIVVQEAAFRVIPWHYNTIVGACLCLSAVYSVKNWKELLARRGRQLSTVVLPWALLVFSASSWVFWLNLGEFSRLPYYATQKKVLNMVPQDKSVVAPLTLLLHLSDRQVAFELAQFDLRYRNLDTQPRERLQMIDYVILDANERRFAQDVVTKELVMSFYTNTAYHLVFQENNVFVFQRANTAPPPISSP